MRFVTKDFTFDNILLWLRFIDDVFGAIVGTTRLFDKFFNALNNHLVNFGIYFTVDVKNNPPGKIVNFLDVTVDTSTGKLDTYLHQKPTDARRYLNFHSFHPRHTFSGITFSQMRRICLLDSDAGKCVEDLKSMKKDFSDVGYPGNLIDGCEIKVHQLDRSEILFNEGPNVSEQDNNMLCFVSNFSFHHKNIQNILQSFSPDLINLIGPMKVVLSARGNPSTRSMLFKQKSFASIAPIPVSDHRCGSCKTCQVISNDTSFDLEGCVVKANKYFTCRSDNVIYLAICRHCRDFYIGHTQNPLKDRVSVFHKILLRILPLPYT